MKNRVRSIWSEFKAFAFKGNMIDLAIAVVIGGAFSGVINSLVNDIIMPSVSYLTTAANTASQTAANVAREAETRVGIATHPSSTTRADTQPAPAPPAPAPPAPPAAPSAPATPQAVDFSWKIGRIQVGHFIAQLLNFLIVAFAVFLIMVKLVGSVVRRVGSTPAPSEPTTKECPECLSAIPFKATRCAFCTTKLPPNA